MAMILYHHNYEAAKYQPFNDDQLSEEEAQLVVRATVRTLKRVLRERISIDEIALSQRAINVLHRNNCRTLGELSEYPLRRLPGAGRKVLHELKEVLQRVGLPLPMAIRDFCMFASPDAA